MWSARGCLVVNSRYHRVNKYDVEAFYHIKRTTCLKFVIAATPWKLGGANRRIVRGCTAGAL
jgi:hypothetical protein